MCRRGILLMLRLGLNLNTRESELGSRLHLYNSCH